eukprot:1195609-Prorocentrum_minimum.AAC.4
MRTHSRSLASLVWLAIHSATPKEWPARASGSINMRSSTLPGSSTRLGRQITLPGRLLPPTPKFTHSPHSPAHPLARLA